MPESLVFSCAKILFLVSLLFVAMKDQFLLTFYILQNLLILSKLCIGTYCEVHDVKTSCLTADV